MPPALIVGGGIGGLAAALALQRAGWAVQVLEQAPELREVGAGLSIWTNAVAALRRIGAGSAVEAAGVPLEHLEFRTRQGQVLGALPAGAIGRRLGAPSLGLHRADLMAALGGLLAPGTVRPAARCAGFAQAASGVTAFLADGTAVQGDLLIGADGLHSTMREHLLGPTPLRYAGYTAWRGVTDPCPVELPAGLAFEMIGAGQRFGLMPLTGNRAYWFATCRAPAGGTAGPGGVRADLLARYHGWAAPVADLIAATAEPAILRNDIYDRRPVRQWGRGRVTLLGDAAHATTPNQGQGACLAIEDAAVLAGCLTAARDGAERPALPENELPSDADGNAGLPAPDIAAALRGYERRRYRRTATVANQSRLFGWIGHWQHPAAARLRDALFRPAIPTLIAWEFESLLSYRVE